MLTPTVNSGVEKGMKLCTALQEGCGYKDKIFHCVHYLSADLRIYIYIHLLGPVDFSCFTHSVLIGLPDKKSCKLFMVYVTTLSVAWTV